MFRKDWATCSSYDNYSMFIVNIIWGGDLDEHLMHTRIFTLRMNKIFI